MAGTLPPSLSRGRIEPAPILDRAEQCDSARPAALAEPMGAADRGGFFKSAGVRRCAVTWFRRALPLIEVVAPWCSGNGFFGASSRPLNPRVQIDNTAQGQDKRQQRSRAFIIEKNRHAS